VIKRKGKAASARKLPKREGKCVEWQGEGKRRKQLGRQRQGNRARERGSDRQSASKMRLI